MRCYWYVFFAPHKSISPLAPSQSVVRVLLQSVACLLGAGETLESQYEDLSKYICRFILCFILCFFCLFLFVSRLKIDQLCFRAGV